MEISPQYVGDGSYQATAPRSGLDREWALLKEAMSNQQISRNAAAAERTKSLEELSHLLDAREASIQEKLSPQLLTLHETMTTLGGTLLRLGEDFKALDERLQDDEKDILQIQSDIEAIRLAMPPDAEAGDTNAGPLEERPDLTKDR